MGARKNETEKRYHNTEILSSCPNHPPPTLSRLGPQNSLRITRPPSPAPAGSGRSHHTIPIGRISIAKQGRWRFDGRDSAAKDTKPKGFSP
jgi:hypothetical protein